MKKKYNNGFYSFFQDNETEDNKKSSPNDIFAGFFGLFDMLVKMFRNIKEGFNPTIKNQNFNKEIKDIEDNADKEIYRKKMQEAEKEHDLEARKIKTDLVRLEMATSLFEDGKSDKAIEIKDQVLLSSKFFTPGAPTTINPFEVTLLIAEIDNIIEDASVKSGSAINLYEKNSGNTLVSHHIYTAINTILNTAHTNDGLLLDKKSAEHNQPVLTMLKKFTEVQSAVLESKEEMLDLTEKLRIETTAANPNAQKITQLKQEIKNVGNNLKKLVDANVSDANLVQLNAEVTNAYNTQKANIADDFTQRASKIQLEFVNLQTLYQGEIARISGLPNLGQPGGRTPAEARQLSILLQNQFMNRFNNNARGNLGDKGNHSVEDDIHRYTGHILNNGQGLGSAGTRGTRNQEKLEKKLAKTEAKLNSMKSFMEKTAGLKLF